MKKQTKIIKWYIYIKIGPNAIPYIFEACEEDVNDDEISLCIQKQYFKKLKVRKLRWRY